jgi:DNA polymerase III epsilon subunit family exonuclease
MEALLIFIVLAVVAYVLLRGRKGGQQQVPTEYMPDTFVVLDLETTGVDPTRHEIIEIAAIRYRKGTTTHETLQALVKPTKKVPDKITKITGITQEMLDKEGEPLVQVLPQFTEFIGSLRLVTFNAEFDMAFLEAAFEKHGIAKPANPVSCALKMARRAWPRRKSFRLEHLANDGAFAEGKAHRALEDARQALIVYAAATAELRSVA